MNIQYLFLKEGIYICLIFLDIKYPISYRQDERTNCIIVFLFFLFSNNYNHSIVNCILYHISKLSKYCRVTNKTNKYVSTHNCYILEGKQIIVKKSKAKKNQIITQSEAFSHKKADLLSVFANNVLLEHSHTHLRKKLLPEFRFTFLQHC